MENAEKGWQVVTGSAGLVGIHVVKSLLGKGYKVRALYNKNSPVLESHPHLEIVQCDILDVIALENAFFHAQTIYHCAGLVSYQSSDHDRTYKINVEGTANVVNTALVTGIKKLIHVSSVSALEDVPEGSMITEKMVWLRKKDTSTYGHSKFLGEMEVWRAMEEGLNAVIVNPSIILGAGNWEEGSTQIFHSVYKEIPYYTDGVMGFVGVKDLAEIMVSLAESSITGERYIVSAANYPFKKLFTEIAAQFGKKAPYKKVTRFMAAFVILTARLTKIFTGKPPFITKDTAATAMAITQYNNAKILAALPGFTFTTIPDVLTDVCAVFKQNLNKG